VSTEHGQVAVSNNNPVLIMTQMDIFTSNAGPNGEIGAIIDGTTFPETRGLCWLT